VTPDDLENPVCRPFGRHGQLEDHMRQAMSGKRRRRDGDKGVEEDRAIAIGGFEFRRVWRVAGLGVMGPMCMNGPTTVVLGRMVIWMCVDERSAQGRSLDGERERDSSDPAHNGPHCS
jgi:hypothetical protein